MEREMDDNSTFLIVMIIAVLIWTSPFWLCLLWAILISESYNLFHPEDLPADTRTPEEKRVMEAGGWLNMHK